MMLMTKKIELYASDKNECMCPDDVGHSVILTTQHHDPAAN